MKTVSRSVIAFVFILIPIAVSAGDKWKIKAIDLHFSALSSTLKMSGQDLVAFDSYYSDNPHGRRFQADPNMLAVNKKLEFQSFNIGAVFKGPEKNRIAHELRLGLEYNQSKFPVLDWNIAGAERWSSGPEYVHDRIIYSLAMKELSANAAYLLSYRITDGFEAYVAPALQLVSSRQLELTSFYYKERNSPFVFPPDSNYIESDRTTAHSMAFGAAISAGIKLRILPRADVFAEYQYGQKLQFFRHWPAFMEYWGYRAGLRFNFR